jgi:hypothetical protein
MNAWWDDISRDTDISNELDADFNLPKIHLMCHWAKQICRYGALQQYSAETHDQAHNTKLMDSWNTSNHNLNYRPQVFTILRRILSFKIRELNLQALAQRWENRRDGKHPNAMIKDFRALLDNTQDATQCVAICSGTWEFIKNESRNKTYISDEQLHAMELCIYHGIKVQVEGLEGERISQMCRCTGSQSWRGEDRWNN